MPTAGPREHLPRPPALRTLTPTQPARPNPQAQFAQHNLPANSKRQLVHSVHVPDASAPAAAFVSGLPTELPAMDMQSVSPSGA